MSKNIHSLLFISLLIGLTGCVEFKKLALYDGEEVLPPPVKPKSISMIVEPRIYDEDATDVWGLEKDECQEGMLTTDVVYSGEEAIKISWNREAEGCKWSGFGIGWDGWAGKDLSPIMDFAAIQLHVRTDKGKSFGLPMVLTLIDYSGGMGFAYTGNKYFERVAIDEEWQKVIVPLNAFDMEKENLDPSNIQQLQIELQQSGSVYVDDISLIFYEEPEVEPWMVEETLPNPIRLPFQVMDDAFVNDNGWGLVTDDCKSIQWTESQAATGSKSLQIRWDDSSPKCSLMAMGASWNRWFPVDMNPILNKGALRFQIKMKEGSAASIPMRVGFEDYDRRKHFAPLAAKFVDGGQYNTSWNTVTITLDAISPGLDYARIKQIYIEFEDKGEVFMDNLQLVAF